MSLVTIEGEQERANSDSADWVSCKSKVSLKCLLIEIFAGFYSTL